MNGSNREKIEDIIFDDNIDKNYHNKLFLRVGAKGKKFNNVDFSHTYFEFCYFRQCTFNSCNFTGC
ncbi:hypothetical protein EZS27_016771 [termite gut metagenome]|uniref:Pentapeptide repeat-containing protein n=1 Tax=termite gut metagenome TaxID=433724 RepID=A0A5J4RPE6_9ZZZZ